MWWHPRLRLVVAAALLALGAWVAWQQAHRWLPAAVNIARALPGVGFGRMHRLEQEVLEGLDWLARWGQTPASAVRPVRPPPKSLDALWPPAPLTPLLLEPSMAGEGVWTPMDEACLDAEASAAMVRTRVRVDPERPEVVVSLVAMDLRHLAMRVVAGTVDGGKGHWEPDWDVIAAFNGAFQSRHGRFGLRSQGQTLISPQEGAATVAVDGQGRLALGTWSEQAVVDRWVDLRQNLQLLQQGSQVQSPLWLEAAGRREVIGHSVTRRSGLCVRPPWTLIYLWTQRGRATALGDAMVVAGCHRGMHLDLNAFHTMFVTLDVEGAVFEPDEGWRGGCVERLEPRMTDNPVDRYLHVQERDFMVVVRRSRPVMHPVVELP